MKSNNRILRTLICIAVIFAIVFSAFYIASDLGHDCAGERCAICRQIELCKNLLRSLAFVVGIIGAVFINRFLCRCCRTKRNGTIATSTLVLLRVKLSD